MLEENNAGSVREEIGSVNSGAVALDQHENQPRTARRHRLVRDAGNGKDARSVRIGRAAVAEAHPQQSLPLLPTARSGPVTTGLAEAASLMVPVAELAAIKEAIADMQKSRLADADVARSFADLDAKFDSMKDSFNILEAHISIGLAKSIAEMMKKEVTAVEHQILARSRYRARYRLALAAAFFLIGLIMADHFHPFFDRVAGVLGY